MKKSRAIAATGVMVTAILAAILSSCLFWSSGIRGRVVDRATGEALANVVVAASWRLVASINAAPIEFIEIQEVLTDELGRFHIAAWGPRFRWKGSIPDADPTLWLLRAGYDPLVVHGTSHPELSLEPHARSGDAAPQAFQAFATDVAIHFFTPPFQCAWRRTPRLIAGLVTAAEPAVPPIITNRSVNPCLD